MSKSHAIMSAILFHMYQQEMPNHEFSHQLFLPVDQSDLLGRRDKNPANSMFFVLSNYEIFYFLKSYIDLKSDSKHSHTRCDLL